jgi:hypothetical protein
MRCPLRHAAILFKLFVLNELKAFFCLSVAPKSHSNISVQRSQRRHAKGIFIRIIFF